MIEALDETIKQLLIQKTPLNPAEVDISFDVPNREWSGAISKPTINVYLHDIRENLELRHNEWTTERNEDGTITKVKLGGRYDLSYLITAWTNNVEDEHRLLWYVLATMVRYPYLSKDILQEPLKGQVHPIQTKVSQPEGILRNAADVWTALDNQLKPVLTYVVTLGIEPHAPLTYPPTRGASFTTQEPDPDQMANLAAGLPPFHRNNGNGNGAEKPALEIAGRITDANNPGRPVQAEVILLEQGRNVRTNPEGRYVFSNVPPSPKYTFLVVANGYATMRRELLIPADSYDFMLLPEAAMVGS